MCIPFCVSLARREVVTPLCAPHRKSMALSCPDMQKKGGGGFFVDVHFYSSPKKGNLYTQES